MVSELVAIRPNSVFIPVATTTPVASPLATVVPIKTQLSCSETPTSFVMTVSWDFSLGCDSPVNIKSLVEKPVVCIKRMSAGIPSPSVNDTISPVTNSSEGISIFLPLRKTKHRSIIKSFSEAKIFSDFQS